MKRTAYAAGMEARKEAAIKKRRFLKAYRSGAPVYQALATGRKNYRTVARTRGPYATGEMKYFDTDYTGAVAVATAWTGTECDPATILTLFAPTVGSAINQRIARQARVLKIKIRGHIRVAAQTNQTAADNAASIRIALVQDMQTNATQMQGEQVMTAASNIQLIPCVYQNIDNFGRFRVIKDKVINLMNPNSSYDGTNLEQQGLIKSFKWSINFPGGCDVHFNATNGGTIADIVDNSWHIIANCNVADLDPQLEYVARVCFKE